MKKPKLLIVCLKKWRYLIGSIVLIIILISMFIYSLAGNLWLRYPLFLKMPLAFQKLSLSSFSEPLCHEDCAIKRALSRGVLVESLKENSNEMQKKIIKTLNDNDESAEFKIELLKVWREALGPDYISIELLEVFKNSSEAKVIDFFQKNFNLPLSSWRDVERTKALSENIPSGEKLHSLILLANKDPEFNEWSKNEEALLLSDNLIASYLQALLSSPIRRDLEDNFFENIWYQLIKKDEKTRNSAIFLARAELEKNNVSAKDFLDKVYNSSDYSIFSRSFAAEILRRNGDSEITLPEISEKDWDIYLSEENL